MATTTTTTQATKVIAALENGSAENLLNRFQHVMVLRMFVL